MKTATILLYIGEKGSTVRLTGVTPPEAQFLVVEHMRNAGKIPVEVIKEFDTVEVIDPETGEKELREDKRTNKEELNRLRHKYSGRKLGAIFGLNSSMPETFKDAIESDRKSVV